MNKTATFTYSHTKEKKKRYDNIRFFTRYLQSFFNFLRFTHYDTLNFLAEKKYLRFPSVCFFLCVCDENIDIKKAKENQQNNNIFFVINGMRSSHGLYISCSKWFVILKTLRGDGGTIPKRNNMCNCFLRYNF